MNRINIENVLLKIGIPAGIKGFRYIVDAVLLLNEDESMSITKELYPLVAKNNGTTETRVERAIRHAFESARNYRGNPEVVEHYIGFENCQNMNSLKMLCIKIKQECKENDGGIQKVSTELDEQNIRRIVREELKAIFGGIA